MRPRLPSWIAALAIAAALAGCRKEERHFVPAPPANRDGGFELETVPGGDGGVVAIGDSDAGAAAAGDGDDSGGGTAPDEGAFSKAEITDLLSFLDKELPADLSPEALFTKLARKCGATAKCVDTACGKVLATCGGEDKAACGTALLAGCPAFAAIAGGASGDRLVSATETWIRDLWGDMVVKLRLSLPDKMGKKVDKLAARHQL